VLAALARSACCLALLALALCVSCTDVTTPLIKARPIQGGSGAADGGGAGNDGGAANDASAGAAARDAASDLSCGDHVCACDDGIDQDRDMDVDGLDPECTGPFDDDEASFGTGRDEGAALGCQDCYWDNDLDPGNDGCAYPRTCTDSDTASSDDTLTCSECSVAPRCASVCLPRTTNGCDCFGCCTVTRKSRPTIPGVLLQAGCSLAVIDNEQLCPRCFPNMDCFKACGECELCPGRRRRDLQMNICKGKPSAPEVPVPTCDEGEPPCSISSDCPSDTYYCQQGCCVVRVL
jgi:hypothetical protein